MLYFTGYFTELWRFYAGTRIGKAAYSQSAISHWEAPIESGFYKYSIQVSVISAPVELAMRWASRSTFCIRPST